MIELDQLLATQVVEAATNIPVDQVAESAILTAVILVLKFPTEISMRLKTSPELDCFLFIYSYCCGSLSMLFTVNEESLYTLIILEYYIGNHLSLSFICQVSSVVRGYA